MTSDDAKKAILKLFQGYSWAGTDIERKLKFEAYWEVLSDLPSDTVVIVCRKASRGEIGQVDFLPSPAALYQAARRLLGAHISRAAELFPVVELEHHYPPEEVARVAQGFKDLAEKLKENAAQVELDGWESLGGAAKNTLAVK